MGPTAHAEGSLSSDATVDLAFTESMEALDNIGSYNENTILDLNFQSSQASLTSREMTNTTLLVGISTKSHVKPISFNGVVSPESFTDAVLGAWGRDAFVTRMIELGKIDLVTIKYPWLSSRCIEYYLGNAEAYTHMVQQIKGCPCWQIEHGTCMVEVELVVKEEESR